MAAIASSAKIPMTELRIRDLRRRSRSARRNTSSGLSPINRAITLASASSRPSPLSRKSAANTPSPFPIFGDNAGGKHSLSGCPGSPAMISGISGRFGCRNAKRPTSSLTGLLFAAAGEAIRINAAELSRAATVWAANVPPASKSCRSRKIGRSCLGIGPIGVSRPTKSLPMRKPSSRPCSRLAAPVSRWL